MANEMNTAPAWCASASLELTEEQLARLSNAA